MIDQSTSFDLLSVHLELIDRYEEKQKVDYHCIVSSLLSFCTYTCSSIGFSLSSLSRDVSSIFNSKHKPKSMSSDSQSTSSNMASTYESSLDQLRSLLPNSDAKGMSDYDVVRSATDYIQTLMKDTGATDSNTTESKTW